MTSILIINYLFSHVFINYHLLVSVIDNVRLLHVYQFNKCTAKIHQKVIMACSVPARQWPSINITLGLRPGAFKL